MPVTRNAPPRSDRAIVSTRVLPTIANARFRSVRRAIFRSVSASRAQLAMAAPLAAIIRLSRHQQTMIAEGGCPRDARSIPVSPAAVSARTIAGLESRRIAPGRLDEPAAGMSGADETQ